MSSELSANTLQGALITEFYGAAISSKAAWAGSKERAADNYQRQGFELLEDVETQKINALSSVMDRHGLHRDEEADRLRGQGWAAGFTGDWQAFWNFFIPPTEPWLGGMKFLQALCDEADRDSVDQLVRWEEAILEFARRAAAGEGDALKALELNARSGS